MKLIYMMPFLLLNFNINAQITGNGVTDIEGTFYNSVIIGTQEWTTQNLNTTHYRNGDIIPQVTDLTQWSNLTTGAWCYYNNDSQNGTVYGKLYNWYAVNDPRGLAPENWSIPNQSDWNIIRDYLGGTVMAGGKMKEAGTSHWLQVNLAGTNESGFTGIGGGRISKNLSETSLIFQDFGSIGVWWSNTLGNVGNQIYYIYPYCSTLMNSTTALNIFTQYKNYGCYVRCIKSGGLSDINFDFEKVKIYPNPTNSKINIDCGNQSKLIGSQIRITNTLGQEIYHSILNRPIYEIPLGSIATSGLYFVSIIDNDGKIITTKKIILQ